MLGDGLDINVLKYGIVCTFCVLALILVTIFKLLFGSYLFGIFIFLLLIWLLVFKIGITIMYPGSSNYFTSDIEIRIGNELAKNLHHLEHCFHFVAECIQKKKVQFTSAQWNLREKVMGNIHSAIQMLSMFENNLSPRKTKMLQIFRLLLEELQARNSSSQLGAHQGILSLEQFLEHPKRIAQSEAAEHKFLCERISQVLKLSNSLQQLILSYKPPEKTIDLMKYKFLDEKLYEVRFGYQRWNHLFEYEVHMINNHGYILECAVIKRCKNFHLMGLNLENQPIVPNGKYIMFCNPNGVYIQFFAVENSYIRQYIKQGYQVILWNYRGYGQSTGSPSITKCQSDAVKVYNYFTDRRMQIQIVHGYSIGGCAAIGLVSKLEKKEKQRAQNGRHLNNPNLRAQNLPNNIKLVIVDRSFSSIGDMALEFGSTLHRLARVVFTFENKNLSKEFYELKTSKLLLWDKQDQVIPDSASVKCGILSGLLRSEKESGCSKCSNCIKSENEGQLNEEKEEDSSQLDAITRRFINRFTHSIKVLLNNSSELHSNHAELNTNHEYDPTDYQMQDSFEQNSTEVLTPTEQVVNQILNILQQIDGGGCLIPHPIAQLRKFVNFNPISFELRCRSYILGLAYYGSVLPVEIAFESKSSIQLHTIKKIDETIKMLNTTLDRNVQATKILQPELTFAIQNIVKTFTDIKSFIQTKFLLPEHNKFGKLVALNSGHNGSLPQQQLRLLMKYMCEVCNQSEYRGLLRPEANQINLQEGSKQDKFIERNSNPSRTNEALNMSSNINNSLSMVRNSESESTFLE